MGDTAAQTTTLKSGDAIMAAGRSPAYPYIDLGKAVELAKKIHTFAKGHAANVESIYKLLGFKGATGSSKKTLAALKYYGLLDQPHGSKDAQLTSRAMQIIHGIEGSAEHKKAFQEAFLAPAIYKYCWEQWGTDDVSNEVLKSHLILKKGFNDSTVQGFINDYKTSLSLAQMAQSDNIDDVLESPILPKVGDFVQWESQGILRLSEPKKVTEVFESEGFLRVEGSATGIPINESYIVDSPEPPPDKLESFNQTTVTGGGGENRPQGVVGMRQETFALDNGDITIQWPAEISAESFEDFSDWVDILKRKIKRSIKAPSDEQEEAE